MIRKNLEENSSRLEDLREIYALFRSLHVEKPRARSEEELALARLEEYNPYFSRYEYKMVSHYD